MDYDLAVRAMKFAIEKHGDQMYGEAPYSFHLAGVAKLASIREALPLRMDRVLATCWLHDTIEDTNTTHLEIVEAFGFTVGHAVSLVTKYGDETYEKYMWGILTCPIAAEAKKCDTMFNLHNSFKEGNQKRIAKYIKQLDILERGYV